MKKLTWGYATILTLQEIIALLTVIVLFLPVLFVGGITLGITAIWGSLRPEE